VTDANAAVAAAAAAAASSVLSLQYKPFTIRNDLIQQASNVAEALGQTFEVRRAGLCFAYDV
jgi:hypothetical protein